MKLDVDYKMVGTIPDNLIQAVLDNIDPEDWFADDYRNEVINMNDTNSIPIMHTRLCATCQDMKAIYDIKPQKLYDKFYPVLKPILDLLENYYGYVKYAAFLARLNPYGVIGTHPDIGLFLELCHRVHVPILTNPNVAYCIEDKEYYWERGNIYEFDNTRLHGVINRSDQPRIHLVLNLYPQYMLDKYEDRTHTE